VHVLLVEELALETSHQVEWRLDEKEKNHHEAEVDCEIYLGLPNQRVSLESTADATYDQVW
jgi:hypothetical protein